ncbi:hypothetical protein JR316_0008613 [Psilocybe cubensis]|uniref:Uncharacterized protein n=2 Tax=Psilocybe cubensis TaxID=181762 RepID=A0ACB8GT43_PSICU|nr:hypothetical protein JR316_0008613 [Psilocybe cubensis]KAH9478160.1 hypothetical protein JR316_0008613 [Psilocybe cubensis]
MADQSKSENYTISAALNSSMLQNFLMVSARSSSNSGRRIVSVSISALYLLCLIDLFLNWYFLNWAFIEHGKTQDSVFRAAVGLGAPIWLQILNEVLLNLLLVCADALLIWRCFHVWGRSWKIISVPLLFLFAETGLSITTALFHGIFPLFNSHHRAMTFNNLITALAFTSLASTSCATLFIAYRIHQVNKEINNLRVTSITRYNRIIATIVESSALYTLVLLLFAIVGVVPPLNEVTLSLSEAKYYLQVILVITAGLAPTAMVARLGLISPHITAARSEPLREELEFNNTSEI